MLGSWTPCLWKKAVNALAKDTALPPRNHDHALVGDWSDHRDCHILSGIHDLDISQTNNSLELVQAWVT